MYSIDIPKIGQPVRTAYGDVDYFAYLSPLSLKAIDIAKEYTWQKSPVPLWSSVLSNIKSFESRYGIASEEMYHNYVAHSLQANINKQDLRDWINAYILYAR